MSKHNHSGAMRAGAFTLVEVVVATTLMILALALFLQTFVSAKRSAVISEQHMAAVANTRSNMEVLVSSAYDRSPFLLSNGLHPAPGKVSGVPTSISYFVVTVTQAQNIVVKNIYVTNSWINPGSVITSTFSLAGSVSPELHP